MRNKLLHPLKAFGLSDRALAPPSSPPYWYTTADDPTADPADEPADEPADTPKDGHPPVAPWRLPRTPELEAIALQLMPQLSAADDPQSEEIGNLYGLLLVQTPTGDRAILKGFSGLWNGACDQVGWVPPLPFYTQLALAEAQTLDHLARLKHRLIAHWQLPARETYKNQRQHYTHQRQKLAAHHRQRKQARDRQRAEYSVELSGEALSQALATLVVESQQDGMACRRLKREQDRQLQPLQQAIAIADHHIHTLKQHRKALAQQLQTQRQAQLFATYALALGDPLPGPFSDSFSDPLPGPTGSAEDGRAIGDRAGCKLLHYAHTHDLKPLALAEFWWGAADATHQPGQFYGASAEECRAMAQLTCLPGEPMLAIAADAPLPIFYQDAGLIVVDKPSGLLSVPGRRRDLQDSVLSRLRYQFCCRGCDRGGGYDFLQAVHRLDRGTSGLLVFATDRQIHGALSQQFAQRQVTKTYEAILSRPVATPSGRIELPLWRDPCDRPKQSVHWDYGKPSRTDFQVLKAGDRPRLRFMPQTGRTHQLRVHAADPQGLNAPILGDQLYGERDGDGDGDGEEKGRLCLHATALAFTHPVSQQRLTFTSKAPF